MADAGYVHVTNEITQEWVGKAYLAAGVHGLVAYIELDATGIREMAAALDREEIIAPLAFPLIDTVDTFHIGRQEFAFRIIPATPTIQIRGKGADNERVQDTQES